MNHHEGFFLMVQFRSVLQGTLHHWYKYSSSKKYRTFPLLRSYSKIKFSRRALCPKVFISFFTYYTLFSLCFQFSHLFVKLYFSRRKKKKKVKNTIPIKSDLKNNITQGEMWVKSSDLAGKCHSSEEKTI